MDRRPLIAHILFRLDYGGLENGVVNVVNGLPENAFRHAIIAMTEACEFRNRIRRSDITVHALNKKPGKDPGAYVRLFKLLRQLRPAVVHTRNLNTSEGAVSPRLDRVPARIHGEQGWDSHDPDGTNRKYRTMRRVMSSSIDHFYAVSRDLEQWLVTKVGIPASKVTQICNGVDTQRFQPPAIKTRHLLPADRFPSGTVAVGSVTRFSEIKDPLNLVKAFIQARQDPQGEKLRLMMAGDGPLKVEAERLLQEAGMSGMAWLPGSRDDVAELMRELDVFVLGSKREGI